MAWLRRRRGTLFDVLVAAGVAGLTGLDIFMRETPPNRMILGYALRGHGVHQKLLPTAP